MPFDRFFTSSYKRKAKPAEVMRAIRKRSWPDGGKDHQHEPLVKLEMRGGERSLWWHFMDVQASLAQGELEAWRETNSGFHFRGVTPKK